MVCGDDVLEKTRAIRDASTNRRAQADPNSSRRNRERLTYDHKNSTK